MKSLVEYGKHIKNTRQLIMERVTHHEENIRKRYKPRNKKIIEERKEMENRFKDFPRAKQEVQETHESNMQALENEIVMEEAILSDFYNKEEALLNENIKYEEFCQKLVDDTNEDVKKIEECQSLLNEIEGFQSYDVPDFNEKVDAAIKELQEFDDKMAKHQAEMDNFESEIAVLNVDIQAFDEQYAISDAEFENVQAKTNVLKTKTNISEIEADDSIGDIVRTKFYEQEKQVIMQLQSNLMRVNNDVKETTSETEALNKEIAELKKQEDEDAAQNEEVKKLLSEAYEKEFDLKKTTRELTEEINAKKEKMEKAEKIVNAKFDELMFKRSEMVRLFEIELKIAMEKKLEQAKKKEATLDIALKELNDVDGEPVAKKPKMHSQIPTLSKDYSQKPSPFITQVTTSQNDIQTQDKTTVESALEKSKDQNSAGPSTQQPLDPFDILLSGWKNNKSLTLIQSKSTIADSSINESLSNTSINAAEINRVTFSRHAERINITVDPSDDFQEEEETEWPDAETDVSL